MNISKTTRDRAIVTMEVVCAISNGDISNDLDGPLTRFQGHGIFEVEYLKNGEFRTMLLKNTNRKQYTIYRVVQLSMTLSDI